MKKYRYMPVQAQREMPAQQTAKNTLKLYSKIDFPGAAPPAAISRDIRAWTKQNFYVEVEVENGSRTAYKSS